MPTSGTFSSLSASLTGLLRADLTKNTFVKSAATLAFGAGASQLLLIIAAPLLTRLYSEEQFGVFAAVYSVMMIAGVASTGRYDPAILIQREPAKAAQVFRLCLTVTMMVAVAAAAVVFAFHQSLGRLTGLGKHPWYLLLVPLYIVLDGGNKALNCWNLYRTSFSRLSQSKIAQAIATITTQTSAGYAGAGPLGLITGQLFGLLTVVVWLFRPVRMDLHSLPKSSSATLKEVAVEYHKFPCLFLPADFLNVFANQIPVLLMTSFFGPAVVGWYALTQRVLATPLSLVSSAILDVFKERSARDFRETGNCLALYRSTFRALAWLGVIPFLILGIVAPRAFNFIFGADWMQAGHYAQLLAPMFYLRFVASPLSYVIYVAQKPKIDFFWQAGLVLVSLGAMFAGKFFMAPEIAIGSFSAAYCLMYVVYIVISYRIAHGRRHPTS